MKTFGSIARLMKLTAMAAVAVAAAVCAQTAAASPITLGSASSYGLLTGAKSTLTLAGSFNLSGNVGVGANSTVNLSGTNNISGNAYEDSGVTVNYSGTTNVTGTTYTNYSLSSAITAAESASTSAAALSATSGFATSYQGTNVNFQNTSVTIKAVTSLSENVLNISALTLANSTLTFDDNGHTGAKFIINITGNLQINSSGSGKSLIKGVNGASASDVIFNVEGGGNSVQLTGNSTNAIIGTILAPQASTVTVSGGGTLTGALIAGVKSTSTTTVQSQSGGYNITSFGYTPRAVSTPEPSSIALFGAGISALIAARRRRRP